MTKSVEFSLDNYNISYSILPKKCIHYTLRQVIEVWKILFFLILSFFSKFREKC